MNGSQVTKNKGKHIRGMGRIPIELRENLEKPPSRKLEPPSESRSRQKGL